VTTAAAGTSATATGTSTYSLLLLLLLGLGRRLLLLLLLLLVTIAVVLVLVLGLLLPLPLWQGVDCSLSLVPLRPVELLACCRRSDRCWSYYCCCCCWDQCYCGHGCGLCNCGWPHTRWDSVGRWGTPG